MARTVRSDLSVRWALFVVAVGVLICFSASADTIPPKKYSVLLTARVQESPPQIVLSWIPDDATGYEISRRTLDSDWQSIAMLGATATSYTDKAVTVGSRYEYKVTKGTSFGRTGYGYLSSGIRVPLADDNGKIILLVESSIADSVAVELMRLETDLTAEGWTVVRRNVSKSDSPIAVKEVIRSAYNLDPANTHALFLFGNIPVPYSGNIAPDGHPNHQGAWPADVYYGDMDGVWTDTTVDTQTAEREANWNIPGDGKFDQSQIPSPLELMVGRVDLSNMTSFSNKPHSRSEVDLLRQYLNKDHAFRTGQVAVERRGLICDNFADKGADPISGSAWRAFPGFFGAENIEEVGWDEFLPAATKGSYLWCYGSGGGTYYYSVGVASSDDYALQDVNIVFGMFMGSYFGDWNNESNYLRAALGSGWMLTSSYSGFPHTLYFPMAMGETVGYGILLSQNNASGGLYPPWGQGTSQVHISLLGDPTLRLYPIKPVTNLVSTPAPGQAQLQWAASTETNLVGYSIFRATNSAGPFERVTSEPITETNFVETVPDGTYTYMVRAVKLEESSSGTYLNPSPGTFGSVTVSGPEPPSAPILQATVISSNIVRLSWTDLTNETSYLLERKTGASNSWTNLITVASNVTTFSDTGLVAAATYSYRMRATNMDGVSAYSQEVTVTTPSSSLHAPSAPVLKVSKTNVSQIDLSWTAVTNATNYHLERKIGLNGVWKELATQGTVTNFSDVGLTAATEYHYRIQALNAGGASPYSAEVRVITLSAGPALKLSMRGDGNGVFTLIATGDAGQKFVVQSSEDFESWTDYRESMIENGPVEITLELTPGENRVFLRAVKLP